jgi:protein-S-isoprenylcysteine O-methyltransferase Ste14
MRTVARYWLILLWILWGLTFLLRRVRSKAVRGSKTAPISIFGMVLQGLAYPILFMARRLTAHPPEVWQIGLSFFLGFVSLFLIWSAIPALGKQWRVQAGVYQDHILVQSGPYRFIRHPIYASMLALLLAAGFLLGTPVRLLAAVVTMVIGTEIRVRAEERLLAERFGQEFADYKTRVPAYIPFVR